MIKFIKFLKVIFHLINFILIGLYLYPGSIFGYILYSDLTRQPKITEDFLNISANHFYAFESENYPVLAEAGISIGYNRSALRKHTVGTQLIVNTAMDDAVIILKLFPGINKKTISAILNTDHIKGVVVESYGSGNVPNERWFLDLLTAATLKGLIILNISQCLGGSVIQGKYQTSSALEKMGVIGGSDLTVEAATTKLMYALANHQNLEDVKSCISTDISGEMT